MDRRAVSTTVLVIGPGTVSGPHRAPDETICAAIDAIDDEYVLVGERPVSVDDVWAKVITASAGEPAGNLVLVYPGWWSDARVDRIRCVAHGRYDGPVLLRRHEVLGGDRSDGKGASVSLIEIAPEFVICRVAGSAIAVTPRLGATSDVADTVKHGIIGAGPVVIDAPLGVAGAAELAAVLAAKLCGHDVQIVDDATVATAIEDRAPPAAPRRRRTRWALPVGMLLALGVLWGLPRTTGSAEPPMMLLTEGRVTVQIPAGWVVRRITEGAGSPRIQAFSPTDEDAAILLTQSVAGPDPTRTADVLKAALDLQPPGVFAGFRTDDHQGGRPVLSYVETRADREITWAVFLDGRVRIAIGCQQPASAAVIRQYCDEAIRSAHAAQ